MASSIPTADDLADILKIQLSSLSTLITEDGYELVCDQAAQELGWVYPITTPAKVLWMVKRGTRHAINVLMLASANKFRYKQVSLNHRFDHFNKLIEEMDKEFEVAINGDLGLFANVSSYTMFGTKIDAGFAYTKYGKDITYDYDQYVNFSPMEE